mgnify:CR=1 FL=1
MSQSRHFVDLTKTTQHVCSPKQKGEVDTSKAYSPFEITATYINGLNVPVTVVLRSGAKFVIPPSHNRNLVEFVICFKVTFSSDVIVDTTSLSNDTSPESQLLADILESGTVSRRGMQSVGEIQYGVTKEDLYRKGNALYISNLDLVVTLLQGSNTPLHPFSESGVRNRLIEQTEEINEVGGFGYRIDIVDNEQQFGPRFVNINNEVFKVHPQVDITRRNGVYRISSGPVEGDAPFTAPISRFYTFEEAEEKLGLYKSHNEAKTLGDVLASRKKELDEYALDIREEEHRLKQEKMNREEDFEQFKRKLEKERLQEEEERKLREQRWKREEQIMLERQTRLKDEIAELEHTRTVTSLGRKDYYEERSYERKDSSEIVKFIPLVVGGLIAVAAAIYKQK